jgi:hypothetical protein
MYSGFRMLLAGRLGGEKLNTENTEKRGETGPGPTAAAGMEWGEIADSPVFSPFSVFSVLKLLVSGAQTI